MDVESDISDNSESIQSNVSSISGLSCYGNEFVKLLHLVNPSKYPESYQLQSSTPNKQQQQDDNKKNNLKNNLQDTWQLVEKYKVKAQNVEKEIEFKYSEKIDKLLAINKRLEGELNNANQQIQRLLCNYKGKNDLELYEMNLILEKKLHDVSMEFNRLQQQNIKIQEANNTFELDNQTLKLNLSELVSEQAIKDVSIKNLKEKVSEQHVEIHNLQMHNRELKKKVDFLTNTNAEIMKSKLWYKEQLNQSQNEKMKLHETLIESKNSITNLNQINANLNIDLSKCKNEVDEVRLQALKEKTQLFEKLQNINLNCCNSLPQSIARHDVISSDPPPTSLNEAFSDVKEELFQVKSSVVNKDQKIEKLLQENSSVISQCVVLQQTLKHKEIETELMENSKRELLSKLEFFKSNDQEKLNEILNLKNMIVKLQIELHERNSETNDVKHSIQLVRDQFAKFKENYERIKNELLLKNKEILKLENEKQTLFMNNNWTKCELEQVKQHLIFAEALKKENALLTCDLEKALQRLRTFESEHLKNDELIKDKENIIENYLKQLLEGNNEIETLKLTIKNLAKETEELIEKVNRIQNTADETQTEVDKKERKIAEMQITLHNLKKNYDQGLKSVTIENNTIAQNCEILNDEIKNKDACIRDLKRKLDNLECERRITDDQKAAILINRQKIDYEFLHKNVHNIEIKKFVDVVDMKLKCLDEKLISSINNVQSIRNTSQNKIKELEILLQVQNRDIQEKRKKMDKNNRILLRKVKEHMKGRNSAEKQLNYLQNLYNDLADSQNSLKLQLIAKDQELEISSEFCKRHKMESEKQKNKVLELEKKLITNENCQNCFMYSEIKRKLTYFEILCGELQEKNHHLEEEKHKMNNNIDSLNEKIKQMEIDFSCQQLQYNNILADWEQLKLKYSSQDEEIRNYKNRLLEKENLLLHFSDHNCSLKRNLAKVEETNQCLSNELQESSSNFQCKVEYSQELEQEVVELERQLQQVNEAHKNETTYFQQKLLTFRNQIKELKSNGFFYQRLINDMKLALKSYVDYNKNLQNQLQVCQKSYTPRLDFPNEMPSNEWKIDEHCIRELLEKNKKYSQETPVTEEIQSCLNKLQEEIFSLQNQINNKNSLQK
ncbi:hypothetical protein ABEB36_000758 [Hypothenemus hampei]|uniref:Coiled-coil domain-containing protein n=1 Tax=Hypothenemus hampei TaxID=57062 RepID=A0ABD1FCD0_HYPHA